MEPMRDGRLAEDMTMPKPATLRVFLPNFDGVPAIDKAVKAWQQKYHDKLGIIITSFRFAHDFEDPVYNGQPHLFVETLAYAVDTSATDKTGYCFDNLCDEIAKLYPPSVRLTYDKRITDQDDGVSSLSSGFHGTARKAI